MRYFYVKITAGNTTHTFTVQYTNSNGTFTANKFDRSNNTTSLATGVTYDELTSGDGLLIEAPDNTIKILVDDEIDNVCQILSVGTGPGATITVTDANCDYGTIVVSNMTGGTIPYTVTVVGQTQVSNGSNLTFNYINPGIVTVKVADSSNPPQTFYKKVEVKDNIPTISFEIISYPTTSSSSDGIVKLISSGGTFNKTYYLYKNTDYPNSLECVYTTVTTTITGITSTTTEQTVTGLTCGAYCFRVIDSASCDLQTGIVAVCSTPIQPPVTRNRIRARYGGSIGDVCTGATSVTIYSTTQTELVDSGVYTDIDGNLIDGSGGGYYKNPGDIDCIYGTISSVGVFSTSTTCPNCL